MYVKDANSFVERLFGLMGKAPTDYGLNFPKCTSIHTFFMRFSLDVYCMDKHKKLISVKHDLKPWRIFIAPKGTRSIIELPHPQ